MPFSTPAVRQIASVSTGSGASPMIVSFPSAVLAGSALLFIGSALDAVTSQTALLGTPSVGGTWGDVNNLRVSGDYAPNVCAALAMNVSAGSPAMSFPFTVGGVAATSNLRVSGLVLEITGVAPSATIDVVRTGTGAAVASVTTATTGTLVQADNLLVVCAGGWFGTPSNPATYTSQLTQENGPLIGAQISTKIVTGSTAAQTVTVSHATAAATGAMMIVLKAANATAYYYEFELPAAKFPTSLTNIEVGVWRNAAYYAALPERYILASPTIVVKPADSTRNLLKITSGLPGTVAGTDTIRGIVFESSGTGKTTGIGTGAVRS